MKSFVPVLALVLGAGLAGELIAQQPPGIRAGSRRRAGRRAAGTRRPRRRGSDPTRRGVPGRDDRGATGALPGARVSAAEHRRLPAEVDAGDRASTWCRRRNFRRSIFTAIRARFSSSLDGLSSTGRSARQLERPADGERRQHVGRPAARARSTAIKSSPYKDRVRVLAGVNFSASVRAGRRRRCSSSKRTSRRERSASARSAKGFGLRARRRTDRG